MNYLSKIKLLFLFILATTSCNLLEEVPLDQSDVENFYKNESDALASLNGAYAKLKNNNGYYRQHFLSNVFFSSDQGAKNNLYKSFTNGTVLDTEPRLPITWISIYEAIKDANITISKVQTIENMDLGLQNRIIGEAKFLRGLHYFNLVRCFGEVPLRTSPVSSDAIDGLTTAPLHTIYDTLISDFTFASNFCWGFNETRDSYSNDIGRVTKTAAHAMLAKVYLQIASSQRTALDGNLGNKKYLNIEGTPQTFYTLAKEQCDLVLNNSSYQLTSDLESWMDIFEARNGNNTEMIFEIQGSSLIGQGTNVSNLFSPRGAGFSGGDSGGIHRFIPNFTNKNIDKNDLRFQNSIIRNYQDLNFTYTLNSASAGYIKTNTETGLPIMFGAPFVYSSKYIDANATSRYASEQNWHIVRLADIYLIRAECLAEINQSPILANADINILRTRVGMDDFIGDTMNMSDFRAAILRERAVELSMEGHRFFDLTRLGVYDEYCRSSYGDETGAREPNDYTWPIPIIETSANENLN